MLESILDINLQQIMNDKNPQYVDFQELTLMLNIENIFPGEPSRKVDHKDLPNGIIIERTKIGKKMFYDIFRKTKSRFFGFPKHERYQLTTVNDYLKRVDKKDNYVLNLGELGEVQLCFHPTKMYNSQTN